MADDRTQPGEARLSKADKQRLDYSEMFGRIMKNLADANNRAIHEEFARRHSVASRNQGAQPRRTS